MKRQHDPSLLFSNSTNKAGTRHSCNDTYKKDFVAEWISHLPEPMHLVKKCPRTTKPQKKESAPAEMHINPKAGRETGDRRFNQIDFVSFIHGTKVAKSNHTDMSDDSKSSKDTHLNRDLLNLTLKSILSIKSEDYGWKAESWDLTESGEDFKVYNYVDYPKDSVVFGETFKEFPLESVGCVDIFKVLIFDMMEPFRFWFLTEKLKKSLRDLIEKMTQVYNAMEAGELAMANTHIFPHQICAVPTGGGWVRGIIQSYLFGSKVEVLVVDFGLKAMVSPKILKYLKTMFLDIPRHSLRGTLAHVKPKGGVPLSVGAKKLLYNTVLLRSCDAKVVGIENLGEKKILYLEIYKRKSDVSIAKLLIETGFAEYTGNYTGKT